MNEALERLETAAELEPDVPDFTRARDLLKQKIIETEADPGQP